MLFFWLFSTAWVRGREVLYQKSWYYYIVYNQCVYIYKMVYNTNNRRRERKRVNNIRKALLPLNYHQKTKKPKLQVVSIISFLPARVRRPVPLIADESSSRLIALMLEWVSRHLSPKKETTTTVVARMVLRWFLVHQPWSVQLLPTVLHHARRQRQYGARILFVYYLNFLPLCIYLHSIYCFEGVGKKYIYSAKRHLFFANNKKMALLTWLQFRGKEKKRFTFSKKNPIFSKPPKRQRNNQSFFPKQRK